MLIQEVMTLTQAETIINNSYLSLNPTLTSDTIDNNPLLWVFKNQVKAIYLTILNMKAKITDYDELSGVFQVWFIEQWLKLSKKLAASNFTINETNYQDLTNWTTTNTSTNKITGESNANGTNTSISTIGYMGGSLTNQNGQYQKNQDDVTTTDERNSVTNGTTTFSGQDLTAFMSLLVNETGYSLLKMRNELIRLFCVGVIN